MNPDLKDIKLLIFDFDGTLIRSDQANLHAANFCLPQINQPQTSLKKIQSHLGETARDYYQHLISGKNKKDWTKLKVCVETNIPKFFKQHLKLYPRVKQTLAILKKRGYTLVLYSNAPPPYFRNALKATGLKPYFDFTQPMLPGATKTSTIRKIIKKYQLQPAVIGDRSHDIEAAKNNQVLSIGCIYGFGKNKVKKADILLLKFSDLSKIL